VTTTYKHNVVLKSEDDKFKVIGTRPVRHDGADKVTGRALYGADFQTAGLLYGKVLRSPHAHARIRSIDTSAAEKLPGVRAVVTAKDLPQTTGEVSMGEAGAQNVAFLRGNVLASRKALYKGHAVAAVAATSPHVAEEAIALIKVDYEVLPAVLTAPEGMKKGAPIVHEDLKMTEFGQKTKQVNNIATHFQHKKGDVEKGFKEADLIVEREFTTQTVHQGYIEPHNVAALWNNDGRLLVWCSTQGSFFVRNAMAKVLDLPESQIKVTPMEIGGGFGGKINVYFEPVAALLSKKAGHRHVKMVMTRQEVFEGTGPTPGSYMKVKIGVKKNGKIVAAQSYLAFEAGAFPGSPVGAAAMCVFAPYDIPNGVIDGYDVIVNKPKTAAYRAPGATHAAFAVETILDEIAEKLKIDPIDLRMMNAAKEGTRRVDGPVFPRVGCVEVLEAMKNHPHYKTPVKGKNVGRGIAIGFWFNVGLQSSCTIAVNPDGTVNLTEGSTDIGGTRTSIAMQAAEVLGIRAEDVHPTVVDTDSIGFTAVTGGSRVAFATGWAAYEAAQDVVKQMSARAAKIWGIEADSVELVDGVFRSKTDTELKMKFREVAEQLNDTGGPVIGRATVDPQGVGGAFAGNIVDVQVDPETGKTQVLRFTVVQDAGRAVHPSYVEGQMQGGSVQGIGWGLNEEYFYGSTGQMANPTFLDYRMPTTLDLPMIDTVIVEVPNPGHPYGVRGVGEVPIVPPPAALANGIYHAAGVRMTKLPMSPGAIMETVWEKKKK
jgi:CO/xanthine dehydrogenase Mo-binding subunit